MADPPPLACNMDALQGREADRHREVTRAFRDALTEFREIEGGYRLRLPATPERIGLAAEFIARERLCCPFLSFRLRVPADAGWLECEMTGPAGTPELLRRALELT